MKRQFIRGMADALDRIGATLVVLSIVGAWFTDQVPDQLGAFGVFSGTVAVGLGVYAKLRIDREDKP